MKRNILFGLFVIMMITFSGCFVKNNSDNTQIANPASTYCVEQGGKLEIREDENQNQYGVCVFDDFECEEWSFFRGECSEFDLDLESKCGSLNGTWVEDANECEYINQNSCEDLGGEFNSCASACRNNPDAQICTMQCVQVCSFENKDVDEKMCGGITGILCEEGYTCKYESNYPDASGICIKEEIEESKICTKEYMPVCGINNRTYSNKCMAGDVEIVYEGICN